MTRVSFRTRSVTGAEEGGEVTHVVVGKGARVTGDEQQAGGVARLDRLLGDQLGGQVVVEVRRAHARSIALSWAGV